MQQPSWTDVLTAFSALGIGLLGAYFAWRQNQLSKLQWKHQLYDRRMAIYTAAGKLMGHVFRNGNVTDSALYDFLEKTRESDFLLDAKVTTHLDDMYKRAVDLMTLVLELEDLPVGPERSKKVEAKKDTLIWFSEQGSALKVAFAPFLRLS
jgi:hypothetical protein